MDVKITQENEILVTAAVEVPWDRVAPHQKKALQEIGGLAQVPGFRKGKAPAALLKKRFKDEITQEVVRNLIPDCLREVVEGNGLKAVTAPRLTQAHLHDKEHLHFVAEIDVKPEIELLNWKGLEAETVRTNITEESVTSELENLREAAKKSESITDRPAEDGDTVSLGLTALHVGEDETLSDLESYQLTLGEEGAHPELSEAVRGASVGDDLETEFEAGDDDSFEGWRGKKVKAYLEVKEIKRVTEASLDDAFAVEQGAESLEDLRTLTEARLRESAEATEKNRLDNTLMGLALEGYDFKLPQEWVVNEASAMVEAQMGQYMQMLGDQDPRQKQKMIDSMLQYTIPQATAKIRADLVLDRLAVEIEAEVSEEELDKELVMYLAYSPADSIEDLRKQLIENGNLDSIRDVIKRRKALDALREASVLTEVDALTSEDVEDDMDDDADNNQEAAIPNEEVIIDATEVAEVVSEDDSKG